MARITQYQPKAEVSPLKGSFAERTTPDKWLGVEYLPFGNKIGKATALAVLAASTALAFVPQAQGPHGSASWKERTTVDKWYQQASEPVRDVKRAQYLHPAHFSPDSTVKGSFKERATPDKWWQQPSEPVRDVKRTQHLAPSSFAPDQQQKPDLDSWVPAGNQPQFDQKRTQYGYPSYTAPDQPQIQVPDLDSWYQQPSESIRDVKRQQHLHPSSFAPDLQPLPDLDSWFQPASEPVRLPDRHVQSLGASELDLTPQEDLERASLDKWWQPASEPVRDVRRAQYLNPSYFAPDQQQVPDLDSWVPASNQPLFDKKRTQQTYECSFLNPKPFPDRIFADRWWQQPNQPQFDVRRTQYLAPSSFAPEKQPQPRVDSWWQQLSEPVRLPDRRVQFQGSSDLGVPPAEEVEEISPDRWQPLSNQPQFDVARRQFLYPSLFAPERQPDVRLDSWWQRTNEPIFPKDRRVQVFGDSELTLAASQEPERATPDKWHPPVEQPLFRRPFTAHLVDGNAFTDLATARAVSLDSWYRQPSEPVRTRTSSTFSENYPAPFIPRAISVDAWYEQTSEPRFDVRPNQYLAPFFFAPDQQPSARLDWFLQSPEPLRNGHTGLQLSDAFLFVPESVTLDKWQPVSVEPLGVSSSVYLSSGYFAPELQPVARLDSWHLPTGEPQRFTPQPQHETNALPVSFVAETSVDQWHPAPNQPLFDRERAQYAYLVASLHAAPLPSRVGSVLISSSSPGSAVVTKDAPLGNIASSGKAPTITPRTEPQH